MVFSSSGVGNPRPAGHMRPARYFCVARKLNKKLQGYGQFVNVMYEHVVMFLLMLHFWKTQLNQGNLVHFPSSNGVDRAAGYQ